MNGIQCSENKKLKYHYIIHLVLYIIIIIFNYFLVKKIFWINTIFYYLYLYTTFSQVIYFIVPTISLIFLLLKILTKKKIQYLKIANIAFCVISIVVGLFFLVTLMINALESPEFCKECPFNLPTININQEQCLNKRCILNYNNSNDEFLYEYFCNYNPTKDFEEEYSLNTSNYKIICETFAYNSDNNHIFENEIINKFLDVCNLMSDYYYICQRYSEPKFYNIEKDFVCPNDKYLKILIIFSILNIIINLILGFIPWRIEIIIYDKILSRQLLQNNRTNSSLNSTKNCSKVIKENGESSFKKTPTETIIVCTETNLKIQKNNNNNSNDNNKDNNNKDNNNKDNNNKDNNKDNKNNDNNINIYISKITNIKNINNNEIIINPINKIENNNIDNNPKNKEKKNNNKGKNIKERNLSVNNKFNLDLKKQIDKKGDKKGEKKGDKKKDKNKKDKENDKSDKDKGISLFQLSSERISLEEENKK